MTSVLLSTTLGTTGTIRTLFIANTAPMATNVPITLAGSTPSVSTNTVTTHANVTKDTFYSQMDLVPNGIRVTIPSGTTVIATPLAKTSDLTFPSGPIFRVLAMKGMRM